MTERRRSARLVVLVVAGLAVAGTSPPMPTPGPTQRIDLAGSVHVTAAQPVAIQPITVDFDVGESTALSFAATIARQPTDGHVIATIEAIDGLGNRTPDTSTPQPGSQSVVANGAFSINCPSRPCSSEYVLVVTWIGAPVGGKADIDWTLTTTAQFPASYNGPPSPGQISVAAPAADATNPDSPALGSVTSGDPVHLTEADRFRSWTIAFHREAAAQAAAPRPITQAQIAFAASQISGVAFGSGEVKDRREAGRRDPPVQLRVITPGRQRFDRWVDDPPLTFDPFATCTAAGPCEGAMTIELAWADGRPGTTFDAAWTIDLAAIGLSGSVEPIGAEVTSVRLVDLAIATTSGSFVSSGQANRGQTLFVASAGVAVDESSPWWAISLPVRALVTARVTSIGSKPLPADAVIELTGAGQVYASGLATSVDVHPGEEVTFAFEPTLFCTVGRPNGCEVKGSLTSSLQTPTPNAAAGDIQVRVDWSMELGMLATNDGGVVITVDPSPSPSPSR